ncbi:hypothetical protein KP509_11G019700 [Ceratopteris richardii]|uniref:DUF1279 domain-containing protein n=1 Tax=Ceratopteris richardii TaxID=49495 RepID=A0A8T2TMJ7_CERRI|nr:hypothetical protein KP509_11G019700 [Ceratopteris richardii]
MTLDVLSPGISLIKDCSSVIRVYSHATHTSFDCDLETRGWEMATSVYAVGTSSSASASMRSTSFCSSSSRAWCGSNSLSFSVLGFSGRHYAPRITCSATQEKEAKQEESPDEVTRKFGLEAGLWKIFTSKNETSDDGKENRGAQAKELLARYGGAYLATSISLSAVSFGLCYVLINSGVDVAGLLQKIGIQTNETGEKVGTFALAYAAHKAASPIRFPPTVALTPLVASWFGKKVNEDEGKEEP